MFGFANRMVAAVLCVTLERAVVPRIDPAQRGFIRGRSLLRNAVELELKAQIQIVSEKRAAILAFYMCAAFPS